MGDCFGGIKSPSIIYIEFVFPQAAGRGMVAGWWKGGISSEIELFLSAFHDSCEEGGV